ncbi:spinster family MFS transporter [Alteromonas gilva]|uniref:MFS transporter n=1 Tax=Alteromonas gilva TaxID=2987522 RepID=A0ABT5L385_9ALTE|nr:MFS transporter [Alteromonas gilva]MDC8831317.1 MFS transporter [Alteromonas gilva]
MQSTTQPEPTLPANRYRYYVLLMLTLVYAVNFIDRQIIGILSPFIKADLGLDDAQLGYLKGIYFALLYTLTGIPIAWLADRSNRINIVAISLTLWSGFTALSGLAGNYLQLVLCRIGVGIGEAGGTPPAHSIIADLFQPKQRATAMAIYALGIPFGIMLAYLASAFVLSGGQANWRTVMIAVGLPGIILALLLRFTVKEPTRQQQQTERQMPVSASVKRLLRTPSWWGMVMGITLSSFANYAVIAWQMDFFVRRFSEVSVVGLLVVFGVINGTLYALGVWAGGAIADRWGRTQPGAYAALPAVALCLGVPAFIVAIHTETLWLAISGFTVLLVTSGTYFGPCFAMAQTLSPANCRAMSTALFFFILNLIALGGGPTFVGILSDYYAPVYGGLTGLIKALEWLVVPFILSISVFAWTAKRLPRDLAAARAQ